MEKIKNYFVRTIHFYNSLEEYICLNVSAIRRFCVLTKKDCVADIEKEVIKQLRDKNNKYAINKPGLWERKRKKWNVYMPEKHQSILGRALEDPEYENFIGVVLILKGTYFGKIYFVKTFLIWIFRKNNGRVQCNGHRDGKNSDAASDNNYSSDSKAQLHLNFQREDISGIEKYSTVVVHTWGRLPSFGTIFQKCKNFW